MSRRKKVNRPLLRGLVALVIMAIGVPLSLSHLGSTSDARFGATEQLGPNRLAAATLSAAPGRGTIELTIKGMTPGDTARGRVDIVNDGTLPLRYSLSTAFNGTTSQGRRLANALRIELWHATTCGNTPPATSLVLVGKQSLGSLTQLFGNKRIGQQSGDRLVAVDSTDTLCYRIELPLGAANDVAGQTVNQQFIVDAEHAIGSGS